MEHAFNTNVAAQYDVNIAILLHYFKYHSDYPQGKRTTPQWVNMNHEALCSLFPYWSPKKIKTLVTKLIKLHLVERKEGDSNFYALTPLASSCYEMRGI